MIAVQGLDSPLLRDRFRSSAGEKELKLRFDVSQYCPEEILVKTVDNKLLVQAKHEENVNGRSEKYIPATTVTNVVVAVVLLFTKGVF
jgi:hypothetical protein